MCVHDLPLNLALDLGVWPDAVGIKQTLLATMAEQNAISGTNS